MITACSRSNVTLYTSHIPPSLNFRLFRSTTSRFQIMAQFLTKVHQITSEWPAHAPGDNYRCPSLTHSAEAQISSDWLCDARFEIVNQFWARWTECPQNDLADSMPKVPRSLIWRFSGNEEFELPLRTSYKVIILINLQLSKFQKKKLKIILGGPPSRSL